MVKLNVRTKSSVFVSADQHDNSDVYNNLDLFILCWNPRGICGASASQGHPLFHLHSSTQQILIRRKLKGGQVLMTSQSCQTDNKLINEV